MDHREAGRYWEGNAEAWTTLARRGYDISRDLVNIVVVSDYLRDN